MEAETDGTKKTLKTSPAFIIVMGVLVLIGLGITLYKDEISAAIAPDVQAVVPDLEPVAPDQEPVVYAGEWVSVEPLSYLIVSPPNRKVGDSLHDNHAHIMKRTTDWAMTIEELGDALLIAHTKGQVHGPGGSDAHAFNSIAFGVESAETKRRGIHFIVQASVGERGTEGARPHSLEIHLYPHKGELVGWFMGPDAAGQLHLRRVENSEAP